MGSVACSPTGTPRQNQDSRKFPRHFLRSSRVTSIVCSIARKSLHMPVISPKPTEASNAQMQSLTILDIGECVLLQQLRPLGRSQSACLRLVVCSGPSGRQLRLVPPRVRIQLHESERTVYSSGYLLGNSAVANEEKSSHHQSIRHWRRKWIERELM